MQLRKGRSVSWPATTVQAGVRVPLEGLAGRALDMEVVLERGSALISGIMIESWSPNQGSAAILYDWESSQLEVLHPPPSPPAFMLLLSVLTSLADRSAAWHRPLL